MNERDESQDYIHKYNRIIQIQDPDTGYELIKKSYRRYLDDFEQYRSKKRQTKPKVD